MLDTVEARKLVYYGHTMRKHGRCLEKEIVQGTMPDARRQGRPRTAWMDNIKTWTGLSVEESVRMTEDRDKRRRYVHGVAAQPSDRGRLKNRAKLYSRFRARGTRVYYWARSSFSAARRRAVFPLFRPCTARRRLSTT